MKLNQLNQEMVNEMVSKQQIKDGIKKVKDGVVDATKKAINVVKDETNDDEVIEEIQKAEDKVNNYLAKQDTSK